MPDEADGSFITHCVVNLGTAKWLYFSESVSQHEVIEFELIIVEQMERCLTKCSSERIVVISST